MTRWRVSSEEGYGAGDGGAWAATSQQGDPETDAAFSDLVNALRTLQDVTAGVRPPPGVTAEVTGALLKAADTLSNYSVGEAEQLAARLYSLPGRGQALVPPVDFEELTSSSVVGTVTYGRHYLGGDGAVYGGAIPLLFDEVLGVLTRIEGRPKARTAFLNVNFRAVTPIERTLRVSARITRQEGRKLYVAGSLHDGESLLADADALFVTLRPTP
jgi:acyl-coenzyme A thioesterase PaaI-like protein